jgi:xanthine dehydrogenase accessory factor
VVNCLLPLECRISCIDPRKEWLDRLPGHPRLERLCIANPEAYVPSLANDAFVLCMTMGHRTDRPVLEAIFRESRQFPYLGVIGSKAKRAVLVRELKAAGVPADRAEAFQCPIGLELGSNLPGEIAVSIAAQLIQRRDAWRRGD